MIQFKSIASGSSGNCYHISCDETEGLIEVGIPWKNIQKALNFKVSNINFVLTTHRHADHSGYIKEAIRAGIDVYAIQDVWDAKQIVSHRCHAIRPKQQFNVGSLSILPFPVPHDVENVGFLVVGGKKEKLLYLTDCHYSPFRFAGLNVLCIECNFESELLQQNIESGLVHPDVGKGLWGRHMSLETVKRFLDANDLSRVQEIHLLHLSDQNSDARKFQAEIEKQTGRPVYIAE